jgi:hypothetical protein
MIIDKSNYAAHTPKKGDRVLNGKGVPVAHVCRMRKAWGRNGDRVVEMRIKYASGAISTAGGNGSHWEEFFESGGRLER